MGKYMATCIRSSSPIPANTMVYYAPPINRISNVTALYWKIFSVSGSPLIAQTDGSSLFTVQGNTALLLQSRGMFGPYDAPLRVTATSLFYPGYTMTINCNHTGSKHAVSFAPHESLSV